MTAMGLRWYYRRFEARGTPSPKTQAVAAIPTRASFDGLETSWLAQAVPLDVLQGAIGSHSPAPKA